MDAHRAASPRGLEEPCATVPPRAGCFVVAHLLSAFGFEFLVFVLTVHVHDLTGSAWNVGVFTALTFAPRLLAPYYGSLVDRRRRDRLFAAMAAAVSVGVLFVAAGRSIVLTYVAWSGLAVLATIIATARTAIMAELFPDRDHLRGNSIMLMSLNAAKLLAPVLGGAATLRWNATGATYAAAGIYAAAALLGLATRLAPVSTERRDSAREVVSHLREGARYLRSRRDLRVLGTLAFLWRLTLALQVPLFVVYVKDTLGRGSGGYGLFMAAVGLGSLAGSLLGPLLATRLHPRRVAFWGLALHFGSLPLLAATRSFPLAVSIAATSYAVFHATVVSLHALRDDATAHEYRGRVYGFISGIMAPAALASILAGSAVASLVGAPVVLAGGGAVALAGLLVARRRLTPVRGRDAASVADLRPNETEERAGARAPLVHRAIRSRTPAGAPEV